MNPFMFVSDVSRQAVDVDRLFYLLTGISILVVGLVAGLVIFFGIRYRQGSSAPRRTLPRIFKNEIEIGWVSATAFLFFFIFWWAAATQLQALNAPPKTLDIHVVAKQWMWHAQQPNGIREINEIHAPINTPVRLVMTSQDVIHSMFLPALRIKQDVLPGRYTYLWFTAQKAGTYHLLCAEFCGTEHSRMTGRIVLMTQPDYARWTETGAPTQGLAAQGEKLFRSLGCSGCHGPNASVHAPDLNRLYGHPVHLSDGRVVTADEAYLRDSILQPRHDIVAGFNPLMPSFRGVVSEEDLVSLIAYLKSLSTKNVLNQQGERQ
ncbi:MAG TPA: cytochrome c oxidase subunit II [Pseudolabrys sp.]|nr:cytochrome c oxidase subunit II [Pseudolabrys sp.]